VAGQSHGVAVDRSELIKDDAKAERQSRTPKQNGWREKQRGDDEANKRKHRSVPFEKRSHNKKRKTERIRIIQQPGASLCYHHQSKEFLPENG
jgi:hypothetical protein